MLRFLGRSVLVVSLLAMAAIFGLAQKNDKTDKIKIKDASLTCHNGRSWDGDRLAGNCEIREQTLAPSGGTIAIDALFSPIRKVNYTVQNARVGQVTDYDKLVLEVWTNGADSSSRGAKAACARRVWPDP